jgi:hypothetical protein
MAIIYHRGRCDTLLTQATTYRNIQGWTCLGVTRDEMIVYSMEYRGYEHDILARNDCLAGPLPLGYECDNARKGQSEREPL